MGGSSKNRSGETRQATDSTMSNLAKGRTDNKVLMDQQSEMQEGILGIVMPVMQELIGSGLSLFGMNPNMPKGTQSVTEAAPDIVAAANSAPAPQPVQSAYDQRIGQLMQNQNMTRQDAIDNQAHAMQMGADFNNDGAVGNDEWRQYQAGGQQGRVPYRAGLFNMGGMR